MALLNASPEEQLKRLSYPPRACERCVVFYPKSQQLMTRPLAPRRPSASKLETLPPEILSSVFSSLDWESLRRLRRVSYGTKQLVDTLPAFSHMMQHASGALRLLADAGLLSKVSAIQLFDTLRSDRCISCDDFGPYLLPACVRMCFNCIADMVAVYPSSPSCTKLCLGRQNHWPSNRLGPKAAKDKPSKYFHRPLRLDAVSKVRQFRLAFFDNSEEIMDAQFKAVMAQKRNASRAAISGSQNTHARSAPPDTEIIHNAPNDRAQFRASTPFPFMNVRSRSGQIEHGLCCRGCKDELALQYKCSDKPLDSAGLTRRLRRAFTMDEILEHFPQRPGAKRLWNNRNGQNSV